MDTEIKSVTVAIRGGEVTLDYADWVTVSGCAWRVNNNGYPIAEVGRDRTLPMSRAIMEPVEGYEVHHIDEDPLNNTRTNLLVLTVAQHRALHAAQRRRSPGAIGSGYKGVSWHEASGKWQARLCCKGRKVSLGYFDDLDDAARMYDICQVFWFGWDTYRNRLPAPDDDDAIRD